jgi:hypothetical protein
MLSLCLQNERTSGVAAEPDRRSPSGGWGLGMEYIEYHKKLNKTLIQRSFLKVYRYSLIIVGLPRFCLTFKGSFSGGVKRRCSPWNNCFKSQPSDLPQP